MAVRIKSHWFQDGRVRPPEEQASVIAVAVWKSATHGLQGLRKASFSVDVGAPFIRVLAEFLVFLATVADRMAYRHDPDQAAAGEATESCVTRADEVDDASQGWRVRFTVALAQRLAQMYQENLDELIGPSTEQGGHAGALIALLNQRMAEYAEFEYGDAGAEFAFLRYFGNCVEHALADPDDRRWVLDQIMATQAPEAIEAVERGMRGVLGIDAKPRQRAPTLVE